MRRLLEVNNVPGGFLVRDDENRTQTCLDDVFRDVSHAGVQYSFPAVGQRSLRFSPEEAGHGDEGGPLMVAYCYTFRNARKAFANHTVLEDLTLGIHRGARVGIVGPNGTGKSTLLKLMAGLERPSAGTAFPAPGASVGILLQEPALDEDTDVRGNVEAAVTDVRAMLTRYQHVADALSASEHHADQQPALLEELGRLQDRLDDAGGWDIDARVERAMDALRCPPPDTSARLLSGGERRRVDLCRVLLSQPDLLLLDEPTNHLDAESEQWLEGHLAGYPGTVVSVTHDRYFLDNVAQWILELDRGHAYSYEGSYSTYLEAKALRLRVDGAKDARQQSRLAEELEWVRSSPQTRHAKARARLAGYEQLAADSRRPRHVGFDEIRIPPGPRLGRFVVEAEHLTKSFGDRLLIDDLSFRLPRGGLTGVIGPNGIGKTTLLRMIVGEEQPSAGSLRIRGTVSVSYVDQNRAGLDPAKTVWEAVSGGREHLRLGEDEMSSHAYVATFGFKGADQTKPVGMLSGGERNRLNLALTLSSGGNVLLLDEPTNDLDIETLASLERALLEFPGCAVITAHDRWFLDRIATHILAWEGDARWFWFEGNFAEYEANKVCRLGPDATRTHRAIHRRLLA